MNKYAQGWREDPNGEASDKTIEAAKRLKLKYRVKNIAEWCFVAALIVGSFLSYVSLGVSLANRKAITDLYVSTIANASTTNAYIDISNKNFAFVQERILRDSGSIPDLTNVTTTNAHLKVSMYTARAAETDSTPCIAASGKNICKLKEAGLNTCANNDLAFGTIVKVVGLGTCTVWDRMNARYTGTNMMDWFNGNDLEGARKHGVKEYDALIIP